MLCNMIAIRVVGTLSAEFRTSAALGPFKYAALTPRKKNLVNIYMIFLFYFLQNLPA